MIRSACSVATSYKPPMLVTRVRLPACAVRVPSARVGELGMCCQLFAWLSILLPCVARRRWSSKAPKQSQKHDQKRKKAIWKKTAGSAKPLRFKGVGRNFVKARRPKPPNNKETKKTKNAKTQPKTNSKKNGRVCQTPAFQRGWPEISSKPRRPKPQKNTKKTAKKHQNPRKKRFKKKRPGLPKPCV